MEVNRDNFFSVLPTMLAEAEKSRFVAVDLEMSGISSTQGRTRYDTTLQGSYTRLKEVAEQFQVLQIGFSFISFNEQTSTYQTRTFNCNVSPLFPRSSLSDFLTSHLDRTFQFSARSYNFLVRHGFDFNRALNNGVSYLSCNDQRIAEQHLLSKNIEHESIDPLTLDKESQAFYADTKDQIGAFVLAHFKPDRIIVKNPHGDKLNGLQIRLVYQIIHDNYPECMAKKISSGDMAGCMGISQLKEPTGLKVQRRQQDNKDEMKRLSGLQILFEALSGQPFATSWNPRWIYHSDNTSPDLQKWAEFNKTFDPIQCEANLMKSRPTLVGHNLFQDLTFIYHTFIEPLPPKLDDFLAGVHNRFPRIVDTKFMFKLGKNMMEPDQTLDALYASYASRDLPPIRDTTHETPASGNTKAGAHNAGFDSQMTAVVFLRQTHDLYNAEKHHAMAGMECYIPVGNSIPDKSADSLIDRDDAEMSGAAMQKFGVLTADDSAAKQAESTMKVDVLWSPKTGRMKEDLRKRKMVVSGETYSAGEASMIPSWVDDFWGTYGNRSFVAGTSYVSFA
ncbi:hypothetical protein M426DRAFT_263671 [Hypoxylon sp. CI-4A]|nr:hypothetical protein M426DRAFT_263671 [Hypoxylon sp. CI-4A]